MKRREATKLRDKAIASLRRAVSAFNGMDDDARQTTVLLHVQHAGEMLLKAGLVERKVAVFDRTTGRSIGFEKCLNLARQHLSLTDDEVGQLRTIDALRDDEQHWLSDLAEELLSVEVRATVGVLDAILDRFGERLADYLPDRGLPITTAPLQDFDVLVDRQFSQVYELLTGGKHKRPEARAKIRGLLALEGHAAEEVRVSERDVNRVEKAIKDGTSADVIFPRLRGVATSETGSGQNVRVQFTKKGGAPVTYASADDPSAAAVREVDLQKKFHMSATELANRLGLTVPRSGALKKCLGIDDDPHCLHVFQFGQSAHWNYSDNAARRMQEALDSGLDMDDVWEDYRTRYVRGAASS